MTIFQRWKQTAIHNKALVLTGVIVAVGTLFGAAAAIFQVCIARESSRTTSQQTEKLIGAAAVQSKAADDFAKSAAAINTQITHSVTEFQRIANASERSIITAQKTAHAALEASIQASHLDQRPWVYVSRFALPNEPEENKPFTVTVWILNSGKTPALDVIPASRLFNWNEEPPVPDFAAVVASGPVNSKGMLPPGPTDTSFMPEPLKLNAGSIAAYTAGQNAIYVRAKIKYRDAFNNEYWTTLCAYHLHGQSLTAFIYCEHGNDVGEEKPKSSPTAVSTTVSQ